VQNSADPFADHPLPKEPLVHCPACGSGLIYPVTCTLGGPSAEIECRCPDCEYADVLVTSPLVAALWERRNVRASRAMSHLADAIAATC
jgi:hypothetical protein